MTFKNLGNHVASADVADGPSHVWEYAVAGGGGPFRGFTAFVQIRAPLGQSPRVEVRTAQELLVDGEGSPCTAIVIHLKPSPVNELVRKIVIYPENELAELVQNNDAPIGRMYGHYDEARPYRFQLSPPRAA